MSGVGSIPLDDSYKPVLALKDDNTGNVYPVHIGSTVTGADGKTYAVLDVNASVTPAASVASTTNSTTALLTANSVFTGTSESILAYGSVSVQVFSDQASASNGLSIQQSQNGTNWDTVTTASVSANTAFQKTVNCTGKFLRVVYTNGGVDQTVFRLQTIKEVSASPAAGVTSQRVNAQSGDFASGSIASGAIASGAYASGSIAAGALADGASTTFGAEADAAAAADSSTATFMSLFRRFLAKFPTIGPQAKAASVSVTFATDISTLTTAGTVTEANSGSIKTDLDTVVTNTNKLIAPSANSGTIDATTQRTVAGGAATGTKSSVASSASSVTILASNTSRKGATVYNDSTQILYLDCSGGTASSTSYTLQISANNFFELPGPNLYNGAITGIWASANGNARITEWS